MSLTTLKVWHGDIETSVVESDCCGRDVVRGTRVEADGKAVNHPIMLRCHSSDCIQGLKTDGKRRLADGYDGVLKKVRGTAGSGLGDDGRSKARDNCGCDQRVFCSSIREIFSCFSVHYNRSLRSTTLQRMLSKKAMDKFPQELIDLIIDQLWDDPKALGTCLSLSRSFRPHAQVLLFRAIHISSDLDFLRFTSVCRSSPAIEYLVRSLHFVYSIDLLSGSGSVASRQLRILFLPNVDALHIDGGGNTWDDGLVGSMTSVINSLTLENIEFSSAESFRRCIRSYPQLKSLNLIGVSSPPSARGSIIDGSFLWRASDMHIPLYALRNLWLHIPLRDVSEIQSILNGVRHSLSKLSISPMLPNDKTPKYFTNAQVLDFSRVPVVDYVMSNIRHEEQYLLEGLQFLELCIKKGAGQAFLQHLTVIVPPLPTLKELMQLSGNTVWAALDTALSAPRFSSLNILRVYIGSEDDNMVIRRNIVEQMPVLHEEGRLLVEASASAH